MNQEGRDWVALALAVAGAVGAISLAGIFIVYLVDSIGDNDKSKPAVSAQAGNATTTPRAATGATGAANDGKGSASKKKSAHKKSTKTGTTGGKNGAAKSAEPNKIPDGQQYTTYTNRSGGYSLLVPKGWTMHARGKVIGFGYKANFVLISTGKGPAPTTKSAGKQLAKNKKFKIIDSPRTTTVGGNSAVADTVQDTTRKVPFLINQYRLGRNKKIVVLNLGTPEKVSKDNADDYRRIASSFRWL